MDNEQIEEGLILVDNAYTKIVEMSDGQLDIQVKKKEPSLVVKGIKQLPVIEEILMKYGKIEYDKLHTMTYAEIRDAIKKKNPGKKPEESVKK